MLNTTRDGAPAPADLREILPSLRALVCAAGPREQYRPVILSTAETFCGPDCQTSPAGERVASLRSDPGAYDLADLARSLERPEVVLVKADPAGRNQPRNLAAFSCPRVLLVAEAGEGPAPLRTVLRYAREEPFDRVVVQQRHHARFFREAGFARVHWLPGFDTLTHEAPWRDQVEHQVVCLGLGEDSRSHAWRHHLVERLAAAGVAVRRSAERGEAAAELHARSLVTLGCSAGGDLEPLIFQVLASGGFLLTDRLAPQAGLERLFRDGEHLVLYDGAEDLHRKVEHYLAHPGPARVTARSGRDQYLSHHRPARKMAQLLELLDDKEWDPYRLDRASHSERPLEERVAVHETLRELHRSEVAPAVLFADGSVVDLVDDAVTLPRLRVLLARSPGAEAVQRALEERGVAADRVACPGEGEVEAGVLELDAVVTEAAAVVEGEVDRLLEHTDTVVLAAPVSGEPARAVEERLRRRGFFRTRAALPATYRLENEVTIGERHFAAGEADEAVRHFRAALAADPENVRALNNLGVVSHLFGEAKPALQFLEQALALDRRDPEALLNLAELRVQQGELNEARRLARFLERRELPAVMEERRKVLVAELPPEEAPHPVVAGPGDELEGYRMPAPPSLRRLRLATPGSAEGASLLLDALRHLARRGLDFTATIVGAQPVVRASLAAAGLDDRARVRASVEGEELRDLLGRCNTFVLTGEVDAPAELLLRRARAAGLVVVTSAVTPLVVDDVNGVVVPAGDAAALAAALEGLTRDRVRWRRLAAA